MALDVPAAVGFESVPVPDAGGESVAGGGAALVEGLVVVDVGGGGCGGAGGGVGGVAVAGGDELGEPRGRPVDVGVGVELVGGPWVREHVAHGWWRLLDRGQEGGVGGAVGDGPPQVGGDGDAERDRRIELGGLGAP